jgi:hypothetical protein
MIKPCLREVCIRLHDDIELILERAAHEKKAS